ncbi:MAG: hypothetical protein TQ37_06715 [Candidatus Synechococcus spongiarum 15L]|uniref:Uncharacterized protein n=1 Tax=Candidatus Synechococcus spongiarum 15L TaxID=1608419 RepID=A0A0G8AUT3_9SYNE|nr:MAG: hypothetical protein TQ37_06715 [Candidatus Synechococcus spongiarum 15L]
MSESGGEFKGDGPGEVCSTIPLAHVVKNATQREAGSGLKDLSVSLNRVRLGLDSSFPSLPTPPSI